ncbi:MAG: lamin tail domain-containing protein [Halobacteriales archaeon]|nr:lamin tail domain-containing protein [Halobacteriales archaeon]
MRRVPARALLLVLLVLVAGCASAVGPVATQSPAGDAQRATVIDVVDGDTVEVRFPDGSTDTVRLLGVDTPEVHAANEPAEYEGVPDTSSGADCLRGAGHDASAFMTERVLGATVTLVFDPLADRRGSYGRLLAYVELDGTDVNRQLVDRGHARVYDSTFARSDAYYDDEAAAQAAGRGLWICRTPATASPTGNGPLGLVAIQADAPGDDNDNLNGEYVVFANAGDATLELGGWTLADDAGHVYTFPDGTSLEPGATVTVHTGSGTDNATHLYWGAGGAVWNNGGDTVVVRASNGTAVLERSYG